MRKKHVLQSVVSMLIAVIMLLSVVACTQDNTVDPNTPDTPEVIQPEDVEDVDVWASTVELANTLKNGVDTKETVLNNKTGEYTYTLSNQNVDVIFQAVKGNICLASISNKKGVAYAENTGHAYLELADGTRVLSYNSTRVGETNILRHGYYYYDAHIWDLGFNMVGTGPMTGLQFLKRDLTFHMYADKLNIVQHLILSQNEATGLAGYGQLYEIDAAKVSEIIVKDASGTHETIDGVDWTTCEYIGFDIDGAGVLGFILLPYEENEGQLTVTLNEGVYTVDQHIKHGAETVIAAETHFFYGMRIYTDESHNFSAFLYEAECERNPLTTLSVFEESDNAIYAGYDALRGSYRFEEDGTDFNKAYYEAPQKHYTVNAELTCDSKDRNIYVYSWTLHGSLECSILLNNEQDILPISTEVSKNFGGDGESKLFTQGDPSYGEVVFPVSLKADETKQVTIVNLHQNWGIYPLKQLSSIQFFSPYYHLSTGVTETNCIAPNFVQKGTTNLLPDFRAMSAPLWETQPQHTCNSHVYATYFVNAENTFNKIENYNNTIESSGPIYADVTMDYLANDGSLNLSYRHLEMPQTDENRTYYSVRIDILEDISFKSFKNDFNILGMDGLRVKFNKLAYLDADNNEIVEDLDIVNADKYDRFITLGNEYPYFTYYEPNDIDAVNNGLIIKDWDIVIGGEKYSGNILLHDSYDGILNTGELTLDLEETTLKNGDYIYIDYILLPWGYSDSVNCQNLLNVRQDSCFDPYVITAEKGSVIEDTYVPKVRVNDEEIAEFTISGGENNSVVRVYGLKNYEKPVIEELVNGEWVSYVTNYHEYDGYYVYSDNDGTYSVAFVIPMSDVSEQGRTFRVTGK